MQSLKDWLIAHIARNGPISVAEYMTTCLLHPEFGYYPTQTPFGRGGDFITAPDISQIFGEVIGLWVAATWIDQNRPTPFALVELGPGQGSLMADILRATRHVPGFHAALRLHLIEASPILRQHQSDVLADHAPVFHDTLASLPDMPSFVIANEFFDALPIRQFQKGDQGWHERQIGVIKGELAWGLSPMVNLSDLRDLDCDTGKVHEICKPAQAIAQDIATRIAHHGGAALIIDYGDWQSHGATFQAVKSHEYADPLVDPGTADLTAHVAFQPIAHAAASAQVSAMISQGIFLERLGITDRARALARTLTGQALDTHIAAHRRLTHPDEMGSLFKVLAITPYDAHPPLGFKDTAQ